MLFRSLGQGGWYNGVMELTAALPPEDLADLDRVCRGQGVNRLDAVQAAVRWYIDREGDLPPVDDPAAEEIEP